ncbi:MAG: ferrochelatase [Acidimicrobiales bacterium]
MSNETGGPDPSTPFDAVLVVSFGGPEGPDDVIPFLENVTKGRNIPADRLAVVGEHYQHFGGVSPINQQSRDLIAALEPALQAAGHDLVVYWGNRNWDPMLVDTVQQMADDGVRRAVAFVTTAYSSNSGCRQYLDDIETARSEVGDSAPEIVKIRPFFNHPGFIEPMARNVEAALESLGERRPNARLVYTAHSIPIAMADGCDLVEQLNEVADLVTERLSTATEWDLVYQSRSGPPQVPWLEPDIGDHIDALADNGVDTVVVAPIGFISDHMEVIWDLDTEAANRAEALGIRFVRAATVGTDSQFIDAIVELLDEYVRGTTPRALGSLPARSMLCAQDCCRLEPQPSRPV